MKSYTKNVAREFRAQIYYRIRKNNVCMMHVGRCGSTVLANMMDQHPNIYWEGEFFSKSRLPRLFRHYDTEDPFRALWLRSGRAKSRFFGFEVKAHPIMHPYEIDETLRSVVKKCIRRIGCRHFILLTRAHFLRRYVSVLTGRKRNKWNFEKGETVKQPKVRVPTGVFQEWDREMTLIELFNLLEGVREQWESVIPNECHALNLEYAQDILHHPEEAYRRTIEWLGLEQHEAGVANRKLNKKPLPHLVKNWNEVHDMLSGTQHEWMLTGEE